MRTFKIALLLLVLSLPAVGQPILRQQFAPYLLRKDADTATRSSIDGGFVAFAPVAVATSFGQITREQSLEVPQDWVDASVYIHLEGAGSAYTLSINGLEVISSEDSFTPSDYEISKFLNVGTNSLSITTRPSALPELEQGLASSTRVPFEGSYIFVQSKLRILDYDLSLVEHDDKLGGQLFIDVVVENRFNYAETLEVGFDVYDPAGKLLDFSTNKVEVEGNSIDTIRFSPHLYGAASYRWNPSLAVGRQRIGLATVRLSDQQLYSVTLFTKRNRVTADHIPFKAGYIVPEYADGRLSSLGYEIVLRSTPYNALGDETQSESELRELQGQGFNTVAPSYPQPLWFYSLCDKIGLYVIEQAAINAPNSTDDRSIGGTPSNDPKLANEYLERVQKMYYRTRNFSCVVAYSLGSPSGNGYNMYKAYQWLKSVEQDRPVIYSGAEGEWNNDPLSVL